MALVDRAALRDNYDRVVARLAAEPGFGLMRPSVSARLVEGVSVESTFVQYGRPFTLLGDEAADRGGRETGPSPMRYFLTGIAFCLLGWWAKGSAVLGVELDSLAVRLETFLDMRGEHGLEGVPPHPQWLLVEVQVAGPAGADDVLRVVDWGIARCPLSVLVARAVPLHQRVLLNGEPIRDAVPPQAA